MASHEEQAVFPLCISDERIRRHLFDLLKANQYRPVLMASQDELLQEIRDIPGGIVFLDSTVVKRVGSGIYSRIKVTCPACRVILLCDPEHRDLIREAMEMGVYGCILEPYAAWEILTMVKHLLSDMVPKPHKPSRKGRKTKLGDPSRP